MSDSLEARVRSLEHKWEMAEARINALEDNQGEFRHEVRDLKRQVSKLVSLMENKGIIFETNSSQPPSKVLDELGQNDHVFDHKRLNVITEGIEGLDKEIKIESKITNKDFIIPLSLPTTSQEIELKITNKDFIIHLSLPTSSQNGCPLSSTTGLSPYQSHRANASPQIPNITFTPVFHSIPTTSTTHSISNQNC